MIGVRTSSLLRKVAVFCLCVAVSTGAADAQEKKGNRAARADNSKASTQEKVSSRTGERKKPVEKSNSAKVRREVNELDDQEVLEFVGKHQPKLLELMKFLKRQPEQYLLAIREMSRSKQRLESLAKRDEAMYAIELELWQVRSKQRLAAAEVLAAKTDGARSKAEKKLESLITQEYREDLKRLELQRQRAREQVKRLTKVIEDRSGSQEAWEQKALKSWKNRISKQAPTRKSKQRGKIAD